MSELSALHSFFFTAHPSAASTTFSTLYIQGMHPVLETTLSTMSYVDINAMNYVK